MTTVDYTQLYANALAEAGAGSEVVPDGEYAVRVAQVRKGQSKANSKPQVGIRLEILEGPNAGKSTWVNQTFTADNPSAIAVYIRIMKSLGVPDSAIAAGVAPADMADYIVIGSLGVATLGSHAWNDNKYQDIKKFNLTGIPQVVEASVPVVAATPVNVPQASVAPPF